MYPTVSLKSGSEKRIRSGHLWIFSNELKDGFQTIPVGEVVEVYDHQKHRVGIGTINPHSLITVRLLTRTQEPIDTDFFRQRLSASLGLRGQLLGKDETVCRLCYSESDGLPGLIVDRFHDVLIVQIMTAGMEVMQQLVIDALTDLLHPQDIIIAADSPARDYEGLPLYRKSLGEKKDGLHTFSQDGIQFLMDAVNGQKTGFFLDQRYNRKLLQTYLPPGARVLDLFCYTGSFGFYALRAGAEQVHFVDASESALEIVRQIAVANNWQEKITTTKADIFPWLKESTEQYDVVILDPPALVKSRAKIDPALRAYTDINAHALQWVKPGGLFATSSCSGLVSPADWRQCLKQAAAKSGKRVRFVAQGSQAPDHPILAPMPETEYLKFAIVVVD